MDMDKTNKEVIMAAISNKTLTNMDNSHNKRTLDNSYNKRSMDISNNNSNIINPNLEISMQIKISINEFSIHNLFKCRLKPSIPISKRTKQQIIIILINITDSISIYEKIINFSNFKFPNI